MLSKTPLPDWIEEVVMWAVNGDKLRCAIEQRGLTAKEVAKRAKVSPQFMSDLLRYRRNASEAVIKRIDKALN